MNTDLCKKIPGLKLLVGKPPPEGWTSHGPFIVRGDGAFITKSSDERYTLWVDGLLFDSESGGREAEELLKSFKRKGKGPLKSADGHYNLVLIDHEREEVVFLQDMAASRPLYMYSHGSITAVAPSPTCFADLGLPMSIDRQGLYETLRLLHPAGHRSLINEVKRLRPGVVITLNRNGSVRELEKRVWALKPEPERRLDVMAAEIKDLIAHAVRGVMNHPVCSGRSLELSLTGGMDSRHILGELLEQNHRPERIHHIIIKRDEFNAVTEICRGMESSLHSPHLGDLDYLRLAQRWLERSGGLVNLHQIYLLGMMENVPREGSVGFDGYLMDMLLGGGGVYYHRIGSGLTDASAEIWNRIYCSNPMLRALMPDAGALAKVGYESVRSEAEDYVGPLWFKLVMLSLHRRSLHYTGAAYPMMSDEAVYFAPGATRRALEFFLNSDVHVAGDKRARLAAMQKYFPQLATYPDPSGVPYSSYTSLRKPSKKLKTYVAPWWETVKSLGRRDPAPETEHEWFRRIPVFRKMAERLVKSSYLARDGHISKSGIEWCWRIHRLGGYEAWTLFNLLSAEASYRCLVLQEAPQDVCEYFFG